MDVTATKLALLSAEVPKVPSKVCNSKEGEVQHLHLKFQGSSGK